MINLSTQNASVVQAINITGIVIDNFNEPLPGVNVTIKGIVQGTVTNADGTFTLAVPNENATLVFSYIGYVTQEILVGSQRTINVVMREDVLEINEVVVTALGIKREAKSLSYSTSNVKGEDLSEAHETNVANALSGKIAGVFVSRPASTASGASKVLIRGNNSLRTNSQPLYVVDGIPINNESGGADQWGGFDYGDGISNINPNDIETMTVLKGPNATALYGQRGSNGVILITTKSGAQKKQIGINFSSDISFGTGLVLPDFQNVYGVGFNGEFTHFRGDNGTVYSMADAKAGNISGIPKEYPGRDMYNRGSWGPKMEGQVYEDLWGNVRNFNPQSNTYDFFNTEQTFTNNLSIDGGTEKLNYRFSASNMHNDGYVPKNTLDRSTFNLKMGADLTSKLKVEIMANYIKQNVKNKPRLADSDVNPAYLFISMPRSISLESLSSYKWTEAEVARQVGFSTSMVVPGYEKPYATNSSTGNPYWTIHKRYNEDERDRVIGYFKFSYTFCPWLRVVGKTGTDYLAERREYWIGEGTWSSSSPNRNGAFEEYIYITRENNSDILFSSDFKLHNDIRVALNLGGNRQKYYSRTVGNKGSEFIVPDLHVINNILTLGYIFGLSEYAINSLYGSGQVSYKNYLFVDFSGRNDWSSTLPVKNSSFFYPSVGLSFIASDAFNIHNSWLSFLKLRGSVAQAGSSGSPYSLVGTYSLNSEKHNGIALGSYTSTVVDPNLKNELTTSYEGGFDLNLFQNRMSINFTYYNASTKNQILTIRIPTSTTFSNKLINAGEIQNKGVELMVSGTPVKSQSGFSWETSFNFSRNRNKVVELVEGIDTYILAQDRGVVVVAEPGKPFGQILGNKYRWLKDEKGNRLIDPDTGLPLRSPDFQVENLGVALPDWLGGFANTFSYKGIRLYALVDISQGGKVFSSSIREGILYGTINRTVSGRDGTYVAEGMVAKKEASGEWVSTGQRNTKQVKAQAYWNTVAFDKESFVSEEVINDMSYIAMREISLSYSLPKRLFEKIFIRSLTVGAYGRNLFYFQRKTDGFSPEASSYNVHNSGIGIESTSLPMMRNYGFNLAIGF
jgi:TonB-linked SusC/RagA family outer membrane protein